MRQFTEDEQNMLTKVNEIGMQIDALPEQNFIFTVLSPYLNQLMKLLKQFKPAEIQELFMQYDGVMEVMRMIEDSAQQMEKKIELA